MKACLRGCGLRHSGRCCRLLRGRNPRARSRLLLLHLQLRRRLLREDALLLQLCQLLLQMLLLEELRVAAGLIRLRLARLCLRLLLLLRRQLLLVERLQTALRNRLRNGIVNTIR